MLNTLPFALDSWGRIAIVAFAVVLAGLLLHALARPVVLRLSRWSTVLDHIVRRVDRPLRVLLPVAGLLILWQFVPDDVHGIPAIEHVTEVLAIASVTWAVSAAIRGLADGVIANHPADVDDNLHARRIQTQTRVLARTANGVMYVAGLAFILMTFPRARQFGASLLASAGVAGLVLGIAARSVFGNLIAGLQIAMAQPLRIDDVLIVQGEWGRVEEITSTYVVLRLWDQRRLIIPLQWFIENPFQNWTRSGAELLGTVFLWVDYTLPVDPIREEAQRLCTAAPEWDGRTCVVHVTDASDRAMQLRILVSARDSGAAFDLRCKVREGLIAWMAANHAEALPRLRTAFDAGDGGAAAAPPDAGQPALRVPDTSTGSGR
jgi:small-conductance mechanosensitive channel